MIGAVALYALGAIQAAALVVLLSRTVVRPAPTGGSLAMLLALGSLGWPLWAAGGLLLLVFWVATYPWRREAARRRARAHAGRPA